MFCEYEKYVRRYENIFSICNVYVKTDFSVYYGYVKQILIYIMYT